MASRQVKCINKTDRTNPHERISYIGGDWGYNNQRIKISVARAIYDIENNLHTYHVRVEPSDVKVIVEKHLGNKYIRTTPDFTTADNLLSLPEC